MFYLYFSETYWNSEGVLFMILKQISLTPLTRDKMCRDVGTVGQGGGDIAPPPYFGRSEDEFNHRSDYQNQEEGEGGQIMPTTLLLPSPQIFRPS